MTRRSIELLYFGGCPHLDEARRNFAGALAGARLPVQWTEWDQESPTTPDRLRRFGSPTVLIEGKDVTGAQPEEGTAALACRTGGAPSMDEISRLLRDA